MLIFADKKIPRDAKDKLSRYGELVEFATEGITYEAISGHPDIFLCALNDKTVAAPNLPAEYRAVLEKNGTGVIYGSSPVGEKHPAGALYNAAATGVRFIHRLDITDPVLLDIAGGLDMINVKQGYTRCSLLPLGENSFITSDRKIHMVLDSLEADVLYVNPDDIILPGFPNGFFGGACGVVDKTVFITGSLEFIREGEGVRRFLSDRNYEIIELYKGPLFDGGSLLFFK